MLGSGGTRIEWDVIPPSVRAGVETLLGSTVVEARNQAGGFSPGLAARCVLADGRRVFIKAVSPDQNPQAARIQRREIEVNELVGAEIAGPRLLHTHDDGHWVVSVFESVDGEQPPEPWTWAALDEIVPAVVDHAERPPPERARALQSFEARHGAVLDGWRRLAAGDGDSTSYGPAVVAAVDALARIEAAWPDVAAGDAILHTDLRADNILVTRSGEVVFVDWPWACVGAPVCEIAMMLPSIGLGGGPAIADVVDRYGLAERYGLDELRTMVAATVGFFVRASLDPSPPGLPNLRAFQRAQAEVGLAWLAPEQA